MGGKIPWRRAWQSTPVLLSGEFHGQRSLEGYRPWGLRESDMTEWLTHYHISVVCLFGCTQVIVATCGILFPNQGSKPGPPALGAQNLSHWTTREIPISYFVKIKDYFLQRWKMWKSPGHIFKFQNMFLLQILNSQTFPVCAYCKGVIIVKSRGSQLREEQYFVGFGGGEDTVSQYPLNQSSPTSSSWTVKPVPGAKKVGDQCS